jgi:hypothetical protein
MDERECNSDFLPFLHAYALAMHTHTRSFCSVWCMHTCSRTLCASLVAEDDARIDPAQRLQQISTTVRRGAARQSDPAHAPMLLTEALSGVVGVTCPERCLSSLGGWEDLCEGWECSDVSCTGLLSAEAFASSNMVCRRGEAERPQQVDLRQQRSAHVLGGATEQQAGQLSVAAPALRARGQSAGAAICLHPVRSGEGCSAVPLRPSARPGAGGPARRAPGLPRTQPCRPAGTPCLLLLPSSPCPPHILPSNLSYPHNPSFIDAHGPTACRRQFRWAKCGRDRGLHSHGTRGKTRKLRVYKEW